MTSPSAVGEAPHSAPLILVHDERHATVARRLAQTLFLDPIPFDTLADGQLAAMASLVAYVDLGSLRMAQAFRRRIGREPPAVRNWAFLVASGPDRHAWQVQADALGATSYLSPETSLAELRRLLSVAGQPPLPAAKVAQLRKAAGGEAILYAGRELAGLFGGISDGRATAAGKLAAVGVDINESVDHVGAGQWLITVRNYHEGTFQHCLLVSGVVAGYVNRYVPGKAEAARLTMAALLHDIGKAQVPLHVLDKPGRLTDAEFGAIKSHPGIAHDYLVTQRGIDPLVLDAVRHHHEALDGSGYPDGLKAAEIGPLTRILTVCDIFAALIEQRSYKPAKPPEEAISILVKLALEGKVDYRAVRNLAQVFDMNPPETLAEVRQNLASTELWPA